MADGYISQVQLPNNETYNIKDKEIIPRLEATVGHLGKNYISYDTSTYTYTANGLTFTLDLSAGTVTANGTATANTEFRIPFNHIVTVYGNVVYTKKPIKSGKYYFCGSPSGGASTSYWCFVYDNTTGSVAKKWNGTSGVSRDYGDVHKNEVLIDDTHSQRFTILIVNGYTASNVVFRPMIWSGDIDDDTFEPYQEPTDNLIETKARAYLNSSVGHSSKNLLDLDKHNAYPSGMEVSELDADTGSIVATATGSLRGINYLNTSLGLEPNDGASYIVSFNNNEVNTNGRLTIRSRGDNRVRHQVPLNTVGKKKLEFTADPELFPSGWYISLLVTGSASETASIDVSGLMLRSGSIADDTFEPYVTPTDERIIALEARVAALEAIINNRQENNNKIKEIKEQQ